MKIKTSNKSKKTLIFSLVAILMTIVLLIPLFTTKPKSKDTTAEMQEQTIIFSIDNEDFTANREMTWEQWVDSEYNTEEYSIDENNYICNENGKLTRNSNLIKKNYYVIENAEYIFVINTYILNIEYENTTLSYVFEQDMTWAEWLSSEYADDSIFRQNTGVYVNLNYIRIELGSYNNHNEYVLCDATLETKPLRTDLINSNHTYELLHIIQFNIGDAPVVLDPITNEPMNITVYGYECIDGWTWEDFVNYLDSLDNPPITLSIDNDGYITDGTNFVSYNGTLCLSTDLIVANREYDLTNPIPEPELIGFTTQYSGSENQQLFDAESDMTWADWINSEYNTINLVINNNQILTRDGTYRLEIMITNENNFTYPQPVYATDTIIANTNYYLRPFGGGGN